MVGSPNASVVLTYWFDYSCPHCVDFEPKLDELQAKYGERIAVRYKNFPLAKHPRAHDAAVAAVAARRQGKFIEMHRQLVAISPAHDPRREAELEAAFEAAIQRGDPSVVDRVLSAPRGYTRAELEACARKIGLDMHRFQADLSDPTSARAVDDDYLEGERTGLLFIPVLYINGEEYTGPREVAAISAVIDAHLSR